MNAGSHTQIKSDELTLIRQLAFTPITFAGNVVQLVRIKAADGNYPLHGELIIWPANLCPAAEKYRSRRGC
ncbi:MAG: hypothetical protein GPOALKHO_000937 [Sodalis sp.]|uniref:hypothetical protein n=1 Tax=Sodalis sp. (in: enterobacteria) TaxID=1898979 RepID=UPI003872FFD2|nr:MAG: hypothetical protein GPOALKHO_000937 [Sodalis sp.]